MSINESDIIDLIDQTLCEFVIPQSQEMDKSDPVILIDTIDFSRGIVAFIATKAGPFLKAKKVSDIEDLYERKTTRLGQITLERKGDYWWVQQSNAYVAGKGYGTDLYIAAIQWAGKNGKGIVSAIPLESSDKNRYRGLTKVSADALKARERIKDRGVNMVTGEFYRNNQQWIFDHESLTPNGVIMSGTGTIRFPVVNLGKYWN